MRPVQRGGLVTSTGPEGPFWRVAVQAPSLSVRLRPGHFVTTGVEGPLRWPLFPAAVRGDRLDFLLAPGHPAAALQAGETIDLLGPIGRPFRLPRPGGALLLIADSTHLPALLPAADLALAGGSRVTLCLWAPSARDLVPLTRLPTDLEIQLSTADGSAGRASPHLVEHDTISGLMTWADKVLAAADPSVYPALADIVRSVRVGAATDFAQAIVVPTIVCGVGACQGCTVPTRRGPRRACSAGPAFDLLELEQE
jgi:dihydroorotate dehydrogenase electron transfer subunit